MTAQEYEKQLKNVWLTLVYTYPQYYSLKDYLEACRAKEWKPF